MVVSLGHRHRLMASEVVPLLDGDAEIQQTGHKGMAEVVGPDMAKAGVVAR